jgi:hypothetical protein
MQSAILTNCRETAGSLITSASEVEILLTGKDLFKLSGDARGTEIVSAGGILWVTQPNDVQDYLLRPGEGVKITRKGMVLVQGSPGARVRIV